MFSRAGGLVTRALVKHPVLAGGAVIGLRYVVGDMVVQASTMESTPAKTLPASCVQYGSSHQSSLMDWAIGKVGDVAVSVSSFTERLDFARMLGFGAFGFLYGAAPGYMVYRLLYPRVAVFAKNPLLQATVDVFCQSTFVYFPLFYIAQEGISLREQVMARKVEVTTVVENALTKWRTNFVDDVKLLALVWIPLHYVNFKYLPVHQRMPFMAVAGVLWSGVLSFQRGAPSPSRQAREHTKV
jgi:hypothetical protein